MAIALSHGRNGRLVPAAQNMPKEKGKKAADASRARKNDRSRTDHTAGTMADTMADNVVTDPRFKKLHQDPRFARVPTSKTKVEIDQRFAKMFTDPKFRTKRAVDKYGRRSKHEETDNLYQSPRELQRLLDDFFASLAVQYIRCGEL